tara:strand:- start:644 stop:898 length:255 start_codon:yes stop_codon:yes gene_type:complete
MNMKECKRLKLGTLVREAYMNDLRPRTGIVLAKKHIEEEHYAKVLGAHKLARYDIWVHWYKPRYRKSNPEKLQCWELMLIQNAK